MTKSKNLRKPKTFTAIKDIYIILFCLFSTLGFVPLFKIIVYYTRGDAILFVIYICVVVFFYFFYIKRVRKINDSIYKITFMNRQITFFTPAYVYITRSKECVEIIIKKSYCVFKFEKNLILYCYTKINKITGKSIKIDDLNKKNFPQAQIFDLRNSTKLIK